MSDPTRSRTPAIVAAVDVGSNTIKVSVARKKGDDLDELLADAQTVRLSAGLEATGRIDPQRAEMAIACLLQFAAAAREVGASGFIGVATEVLRVANNGEELLARIALETPWRLKVISGDEEARLTYAGIRLSLQGAVSAVVADIGGASTELISATGDAAEGFISIKIGSGRLTDRFVRNDPPTNDQLRDCREAALTTLGAADFRAPAPLERLLVTGGTGLYLSALVGGDSGIPPARLAMARQTLLGFPSAILSDFLHIPVERAKVLPAGVAVVEAMTELWRPRELQMTASGIRRGLLLRYFAGESDQG
jgi:exopolyphosphatase/guanosine-5'-triphosphate,3'-diphosphate pyrophosphatase